MFQVRESVVLSSKYLIAEVNVNIMWWFWFNYPWNKVYAKMNHMKVFKVCCGFQFSINKILLSFEEQEQQLFNYRYCPLISTNINYSTNFNNFDEGILVRWNLIIIWRTRKSCKDISKLLFSFNKNWKHHKTIFSFCSKPWYRFIIWNPSELLWKSALQ